MRTALCFLTALLLSLALSPHAHAGTWDTLYTRYTGLEYTRGLFFTPNDSLIVMDGLDEDNIERVKAYKVSTGEFAGILPFEAIAGFTRDGQYAIGKKDGRIALLNWHTWERVVDFDSSSWYLSSFPILSDDGATLIACDRTVFIFWDAHTGKRQRTLQIYPQVGDGEQLEHIGSSAILSDGKTGIVQYDTYNTPEQKFKFHAVSVDLQSGAILSYNHDAISVYAIPGSNDVILGHAPVGQNRSLFYRADGHSLEKKFDYPAYASDGGRVAFNQDPRYFLHVDKVTSLSIIETETGVRQCHAIGEFGAPASLSNNKQYIATTGSGFVFMYEVQKLCSTTTVISPSEDETSLSPLPTNGILSIRNSTFSGELQQVQVSDMQGSYIFRPLIVEQSPGLLRLDVSSLPSGRYTVHIQQGGKTFSYPFILSK